MTGEKTEHRPALIRRRAARAAVAIMVVAGFGIALSLDTLLAPDVPIVWVYAVPVLLASYVFEPRVVGLTAGAALLAFVIAVWLQQMWTPISLYSGLGLLLVTGLITRLAYHRSVAMHRAVYAEAAEREAEQARADAEAARDVVRQQVSRLRALADASRAFASELDLTPLLDVITREAGRALGDGSVLYLLEDRHLIPSAMYHADAERVAFMRQLFAEVPLQLDEGIGGQVVQTGLPVRLPVISPEEHRRMLRPEHWSVAERLWVHSALGVPLRMRASVLGVLVLWRDTPERPYTEEDEVLLQEFADRAALAVERARLYEIERQAVRARNEFISVAAHELRTPITALRGYAQRAQRHLARAGQPVIGATLSHNGDSENGGLPGGNGAMTTGTATASRAEAVSEPSH
ncbi:MAG TPA: GAF domain-containing protein, partial [Chloroflexota bacterium]|nr:GAF domain-containing protein [Chloroflexota bacterium]